MCCAAAWGFAGDLKTVLPDISEDSASPERAGTAAGLPNKLVSTAGKRPQTVAERFVHTGKAANSTIQFGQGGKSFEELKAHRLMNPPNLTSWLVTGGKARQDDRCGACGRGGGERARGTTNEDAA